MRDDRGPFIVRRESSVGRRSRVPPSATEIEDEIEEAARRADIGCR